MALCMCIVLLGCSVPKAASVPVPLPEETPVPVQMELTIAATPAPTSIPTPTPEPTPDPTPEPTPTPDPHTLLPAEPGTYTIAWLSDTQHYSKKFPETFRAMTGWLRDNAELLNLSFIVHTGDLVHNYEEEEQWKNANAAMKLLKGLPYGTLAGNHDVGGSKKDFSAYCKAYGKRTAKESFFGGSYQDGRCHYDLIDAGRTRYVFVFVSCGLDNGCIKWANKIFQKYPDRTGILCTHSYLTTELGLSNEGQRLHDTVVAVNPNVYMVLCGDDYNCFTVPETFDDDGDGVKERTVLQIICNYQAAGSQGGSGYMRLMRVNEDAGIITFFNYSPTEDDFVYYDLPERAHEKYVFTPGGEEGFVSIPWPLNR